MKKIIFIALVLSGIAYGSSGEEIAIKNGCMDCHKMASKNIAPAFLGTARRNIRLDGDNARVTLANAIKNGSHGKYKNFLNEKMPAFPNLSDDEVNTLVSWILDAYKDYRNKNR